MWMAKCKDPLLEQTLTKIVVFMPYMNKNKVSLQDPHNKQATRWWLKPHATGLEQILEKHIILHHIFFSS